MVTVGISKYTRERIRKYSHKGESVNDALIRLFSESNIPNENTPNLKKERTNIRMKKETLELMNKYKLTPQDSYDETINRLLSESEKKH